MPVVLTMHMNRVWVVLIFLISAGAIARAQEATAHATYSSNDKLIGLTGLSPLQSCTIRSMQGKVKDVKVRGDVVRFDLDSKTERMTFRFPINRLASAEQYKFRKDFLHKGLLLRASGYACSGEDEPLEAISIDRVY